MDRVHSHTCTTPPIVTGVAKRDRNIHVLLPRARSPTDTRTMTCLALMLAATLATPAAELRDWCGSFDVHLKSASGDAMEDDMTVTLVFADGTSLPVPLPPALYEPRGTLKNVTNRCTQLTAFNAGGNRALLLLSRNGRPHWDILDAVLIDVQRQRILDVKTSVGEIKTEDRVIVARRVSDQSFDVLLIREQIESSGCDCAAAAIEGWTRIAVRGDRIYGK
jgi:hypothetical protein